MAEKGKPQGQGGHFGGEMPPPYTAGYGQAPPVYMVDPPMNTVPNSTMGVGFEVSVSAPYVQQAPYVVPGNTAVVQVVQFSNLRNRSTRLVCPHCRADVSTRVSYRTGRFTHIAALVLCLICCPLGVLPYCLDECQDAEHYCPNCQRFIGLYRK